MALTKITPQMFDTSAAGHDFNIDNGTFVVDASANRVGIGTATPSTLLHVNGTATATTFVGALTGNVTGNVSGTAATVTGAAQTNITSLGTLSSLTISGDLTVDTSTLKVDSTNNRVLIGKSSTGLGNAGVEFEGGQIKGTSANQIVQYLNRTSSDGPIIELRKDNTAVGVVGTVDGDLNVYASASGHKGLRFGNGYIAPTSNSTTVENNTVDLGLSSYKFKDGYFAGNITGTLSTAAQTNITSLGTLSSLTISGDLTVDSGGSVGIGTSSPSSYYPGATDLVLSGTGDSGLTINSGTSSTSRIHFADGTSGDSRYRGYVVYVHTDDSMQFATTGSEAMRIDSSQNLLVSHTGSVYNNINTNNTVGLSLTENGELFACSSESSGVMILNRKSSNGAIATFRKDGSTVGSIASTDGTDLQIGSGNCYLRFDDATNQILPTNAAGAKRDATLDLGDSDARYKDLYLSGGVYVGGTGSANELSDYEEGHYTPTIEVQSGTSTLNTNADTLFYTKVGRQVTVQGRIRFSAISASGYLRVYLPFTNIANVSSTQGDYAYFSSASHGGDVDTNYGVFAEASPGLNYATLLQKFDNAGWNYWDANKFSAGDYLYFTGTYFTNS